VSNSQLILVLSQHGLTYRRYQKIIEKYGELTAENLEQYRNEKEFSWLTMELDNLVVELQIIETTHKHYAISILTIVDPQYPTELKIIDDVPLVLFYQGNIELLGNLSSCLTVVGSRNNSKYSEIVLNEMLPNSVQQGIVVVSGLAEGVDGLSHKIALENNGKTIAVIGSGLNEKSFFPASNWGLFLDIISSGGLVLSEYPVNTPPLSYHFPQRNRILAALSNYTWVVEASIKSGSMKTVSFARKYGRNILTNPANLFVNQCSGNVDLMKNGATIIFDAQDIVSLYSNKQHSLLTSKLENTHPIFTYFTSYSMSVEELLQTSQLSFSELNAELSMAELDGVIDHLGENIWQKKSLF
jgi:DNA processing protein